MTTSPRSRPPVAVRAKDVLGPGSPLSKSLAGYEDRPAQLEMAEAVERALGADRPLFVEAGTGTGKTLAYLVPAILSGKKVIISTATRALQEQIFTKDLPLVASALAAHGITFRAAMMKGLTNYLCKRRFGELFQVLPEAASTGGRSAIERWARATETGDRAELTDVAEDDAAWRDVQSSTDTRIGAECPHFDACFVTRMRREADEAELVIVNHHLFFADLALRASKAGDYASAIPNYDAVIFDEAHQLEDIATDFFGVRVSTSRVEALTRDASRSFGAAKRANGRAAASEGRIPDGLLEQANGAARAFFGSLADGAGRESRRALVESDWTPRTMEAFGKLDACLEAVGGYADAGERDEAVAMIGRRVRDLRADLREVIDGARAAWKRVARESEEDGGGEADFAPEPLARVAWLNVSDRALSVGASPIELGPTLRAALFDKTPSVICTSATLATSSARAEPSFHFTKARLGAPPETDELVVASPFDFASRAMLYVTRDLPEPSSPEFEAAAVDRIVELVEITGGGAFVLCTSTRAMKRLHAALAGRLPSTKNARAGNGRAAPPLMQGQAPKHVLLTRFREDGHAVLVATMSFWEGVDVPGDALRLVILDKIPFAVPTDPIVAARCAELERSGGNPFAQYSVPAAAITLKQGFGRLLRTQKDAGIVAVLDRRLVTRGYGKSLLASLPPARRTESLEELRAFWSAFAVPS